MYPEETKLHDLKLEIGLLKKDNELLTTITNKLSDSIDKIQELNGNLLRMISLHDQKHDIHTKTENELKDDIKELHSRITTVTRELHDKIDSTEKHLGDKIDALRNELKNHEGNDETKNNLKINEILSRIENYKYLILGVAIATGFALGHINTDIIGMLLK
jgi:DNA repair exonuclease SbcCD ATPase subunit